MDTPGKYLALVLLLKIVSIYCLPWDEAVEEEPMGEIEFSLSCSSSAMAALRDWASSWRRQALEAGEGPPFPPLLGGRTLRPRVEEDMDSSLECFFFTFSSRKPNLLVNFVIVWLFCMEKAASYVRFYALAMLHMP